MVVMTPLRFLLCWSRRPCDTVAGSVEGATTHRMSGDHSTFAGQRIRELAPRADAELRVDLAQLVLDRAHAEKQRLGDVAIGQSAGGHLGDAALARRERLD